MSTDRWGNTLFAIYGTCAERYPTSFRAELSAALRILSVAMPPLIVWSDNAEVVKGFQRGRAWCTSAGREGADLWRICWARLDDIGHGILVRKVKGHSTAADVLAGRTTACLKRGNDAADLFAVQAKKLAADLSPVTSVLAATRRAVTYYAWAARVVQHWDEHRTTARRSAATRTADSHGPDGPPSGAGNTAHRRRTRRRGPTATHAAAHQSVRRAPVSVHGALPHRLWAIGGRWKCSACRRTAFTDRARRAMARTPCGGTAAARVVAATAGGHSSTQLRVAEVERSLKRMGAIAVQAGPPKRRRRRASGVDDALPAPTCDPTAVISTVDSAHGDEAMSIDNKTNLDNDTVGAAMLDSPVSYAAVGSSSGDVFKADGGSAAHEAPGAELSTMVLGGHDGDAEHLGVQAMTGDDMNAEDLTDGRYGDAHGGIYGQKSEQHVNHEGRPGPARCLMPSSSTDPPPLEWARLDTALAQTHADRRHEPTVGRDSHQAEASARSPGDHRRVSEGAHIDVKRRRITGKSSPSTAFAAQRSAAAPQDAPAVGEGETTSAALPRTQTKWGYGHKLSITAGVVWCRNCGHHAATAVRSLARPCSGPAKGPYVSRLRRLRAGIHPVSGRKLE